MIRNTVNETKRLVKSSISSSDDMQKIIDESKRIHTITRNIDSIIDDLDSEFEHQTTLTKKDVAFLFFATALQCVRQYLITDSKDRVSDQEAAKNTKGHIKEHSNRSHRWYNPPLEEVVTNPVPYDAMYGSKNFGLKLGGSNHRTRTLGHDPVLGWLFGTANIATSTITVWDLMNAFPPLATYHVRSGTVNNGSRDKIIAAAKNTLVFEHMRDKLFHRGSEGKAIIGTSLVKQGIHLASDVKSYKSLPIPILNGISPGLANELASYGIDTGSIIDTGKQIAFASIINILIAMIHRFCYDEANDKSLLLYSVRTQKIIALSNLIASSSNVLYVTFGTLITKNPKIMKKLDIGGFIVTIHQLIKEQKLKDDIKEEFIRNNFASLIDGK
jgi:hypothetical protein